MIGRSSWTTGRSSWTVCSSRRRFSNSSCSSNLCSSSRSSSNNSTPSHKSLRHPHPGPSALASSTPLPQGSDTHSQTTVIFQTPSGASTPGQSVGSSSSTSSTKFVITDTEGRTIGLSDLNLSDLNASFAGIPSVPSTPMTHYLIRMILKVLRLRNNFVPISK